jgi:hypothetical protein
MAEQNIRLTTRWCAVLLQACPAQPVCTGQTCPLQPTPESEARLAAVLAAMDEDDAD